MEQRPQRNIQSVPKSNYEQARLEEDYNQQIDHELDQLVENLSNIIRSSKVITHKITS
jgi:hypothetical protein